jgi:hypothetical protein
MIKYLFVLLLFSVSLIAEVKNTSASYDISYGIFGKLGESKAHISITGDTYTIEMEAFATGFAKYVSGGLHESYLSKGFYKNGKFQPKYFKKVTSQKEVTKTFEYNFDYKKKKIYYSYMKKYKQYDDPLAILDTKKENKFIWKTHKENKILEYWATEDILSLFFNIQHYIKDFSQEYKQSIITVGAGKSRGGKVDIEIPNKKNKKELEEELGQKDNILIVKIYKDIFTSKKGELYISLNDKGLCNQAILKDVVLFGDIIGRLQ